MKPSAINRTVVIRASSEYSRLLLDINTGLGENRVMWKPIACGFALAGAAWAQAGMEGTWQGALEAGGVRLRVGLHIAKNEKGEWSSTFDSIDQGAMGLPVKVTTVSGKALHFEM